MLWNNFYILEKNEMEVSQAATSLDVGASAIYVIPSILSLHSLKVLSLITRSPKNA